MAAQNEKPPYWVDGILTSEAGMNAGVDPQLLPPNQVAFATNCTFRGGFAKHRPPYRKIAIDFDSVDEIIQSLFEQGQVQGAGVYQPDLDATTIAVQSSGRTFILTPDPQGAASATIKDVTIPGDPNPATANIAWLCQAEQFLIINDGSSNPIFYDGVSSKRANAPDNLNIATVKIGTVAPAVGANVEIQITSAYAGPAAGTSAQINDKTYTIVSWRTNASGPGWQVTLKKVFGTATTIPKATNIYKYPYFAALMTNTITTPPVLPTIYFTNNVRLIPKPESQIPPIYVGIVDLDIPYTGAIGDRIKIGGLTVFVSSVLNGGLTLHILNTEQYVKPATYPNLPVGGNNLVTKQPTPNPTLSGIGGVTGGGSFTIPSTQYTPVGAAVVGLTTEDTASPAIDANVTLNIAGPFTAIVGDYVFLGNEQFKVVSFGNNTALDYFLTLTNVDDTPGAAINAGTIIKASVPHFRYELPPGRMAVYGLGRVWMCLPDGRSFIASDLVNGSSGTIRYNGRDAVLKVTENTFLAGGGTFVVPGNQGDIRAMKFVSTLDVSLGQGPLQVFTGLSVFTCMAPTDRFIWQNLTNPILTQALIGAGSLSQDGTTNVNSDVIMRSPDGTRSLVQSRRDFQEHGNVPDSREVQVILERDTASLIQWESAVQFNNRYLLGVIPTAGPYGVYCQGLIARNFDPISSLRGKEPEIYDGLWTGLNIIKVVSGMFNGIERSFALCYQTESGKIELWELQSSGEFDDGNRPITWSFESAALFNKIKGKQEFDFCELKDGEIQLSDIRGPVNIQAWFKPVDSQCWTLWHSFSICANNQTTDAPLQQRQRLGLGQPPVEPCDPTTNLPYRIARNHQVRFQITGACRFMGGLFKAVPVDLPEFAKPICDPVCGTDGEDAENCEPCKDQGDCTRFDFVFYNMNSGKEYANPLLSFQIECPDGSTRTVYVSPGEVTFTFPYPAGYAGPYPPIVLGCAAGGNITRTIPDGATQEQIDAIVNGMIEECARAIAESRADCSGTVSVFKNQTVYFNHACGAGETLAYTGSLPSWITLDTANSRLVGAAGTYSSNSQASANAIAQAVIDGFGNQELGNGHLHCVSPCISHSTDVAAASTFNPSLMVASTDNADRLFTFGFDNTFSTASLVVRQLSDGSVVNTVPVSFPTTYGAYCPSTQQFFCLSVDAASTVDVFDLSGNLVTSVDLSGSLGTPTSAIAYDANTDRVYVAGNRPADTMTVIAIKPSDFTVTESVIGSTPSPSPTVLGFCTTAMNGYLAVDGVSFTVLGPSQIAIIRLSDMTYIGAVDDAGGGNSNCLCPATSVSRLYRSTYNSGTFDPEIWEIDPVTATVTHIYTGVPTISGMVFDPVNARVIGQPRNGSSATGVVIDPASHTVFCNPALPPGANQLSTGTIVADPVAGTVLSQSVAGSNNLEIWG